MTNREFLTSVIYAHISEDMDAKANDLLIAMNAKNEKRKSSESKEKKAVIDRRNIVLSILSAEPASAEAIAEKSGLSVGQVRSALTALVKAELAVKMEVKSGKTRKMNYSLKG